MGKMSTWWIWSLVYFHSFEALNDAFEVQFFSGLHFYTLSKTLIACRAMQLRFFKVKTLLNNAFKRCCVIPGVYGAANYWKSGILRAAIGCENGGLVSGTYPSYIIHECPPPPGGGGHAHVVPPPGSATGLAFLIWDIFYWACSQWRE